MGKGGAIKRPAVSAMLDEESASNKEFRVYNETTADRVRELYKTMRTNQTHAHVTKLRQKYGKLGSVRMGVWEALDKLNAFIDVSDPDVELPNLVHLFQTAESIRKAGLPEWLQLTGLIHDLGKAIYLRGCDEDGTSVDSQFSVVGDTFVLGCDLPECCVFPEFNPLNGDAGDARYAGELGVWSEGCGLSNVLTAYGHDEYMYEVLRQNEGVRLPPEALYIIRFHSCYPWHTGGAYSRLEDERDRMMKGWVLLFNQHDLYTKENTAYTEGRLRELRAYYTTLTDKYWPAVLDW